jgi:hypothetical protein
MPNDVAQRLKQISVDPSAVALAAAVDPSKVGLPKPARDLTAGTAKFKTSLSAGGQTMNLDSSTEVKDQSQSWLVVESMNTPTGAVTDNVVLDKGKLTITERHIKQGPVAIDLMFNGSKVTGTMAINGQSKPVNIDLGGPDFADGASSMDVIAALPLADGYQTTFYNFDVQKMQPRVMQLNVAGTESVTVPAGTFDSYKVELKPTDGGTDHITVWVAKDQHEPVKYSAVLGSMGGATLTAEKQ